MKEVKGGRWRIFKKPNPDEKVVFGIDTASGKLNANDSTIQGISVNTGDQVAVLGGKYTPEDIAVEAIKIGYLYYYKDKKNAAEIAVEKEFHGATVISRLLTEKYPSIYYHAYHQITFASGANEYGWSPRQYRQMAIDLLQTDIAWSQSKKPEERSRAIWIHDPETRRQLLSFERNKKSGRFEARNGKFDDLVSALMIANFVRHERMDSVLNAPEDLKPKPLTHADIIMAGLPRIGSRDAGPRNME